MNKLLVIRSIMISLAVAVVLGALAIPQIIHADLKNLKVVLSPATLIKNGHLTICKLDKSSYEVVRTEKMIVTAYSSTPDQTDSTPFTTASGKRVADGIIAINGLPFGTKVRIPELYGNKIFTVEDRMHPRMGTKHADIWFPGEEVGRQKAREFGAKFNVKIELLES